MRAMLTTAHGDRSVLRYVEDFPDPVVKDSQVLVRISATALNFHDIFTRRGMPGIKIDLPVIVGSDIAGTVVSLGSAVKNWAVGDRVLIDPITSIDGRAGMLGETMHGGRAELIAVESNQLVSVPDSVSLESAASLPLAYGTAYRMMMTQGQVKARERVLVLGASGGVGVACVQLALMAGAEVIACASSPSKLERLRALGVQHVIDYTSEDMVAAIRSRFGKPRTAGPGGVNVAINFTGGSTWKPTQQCVARGGRILTCGATAGYEVGTDLRYLWSFEHTMIGSDGWTRPDLQALLDLVAAGKMQPVVDRTMALTECAEGERLLEERQVFGKILIKP